MSVRIVHTLPKGHWRAFVAQHPQCIQQERQAECRP